MNGWSARRKTLTGTAIAVALATTAVALLWPPAQPAPREREYQAATACLLTDDKGIAADPAKTVWSGMQDASLATHIKVQHLAVYGPQTPANALSYLNSLGAQKCTMILAIGEAAVSAMAEGHGRLPGVKHVAIGGDAKAARIKTVPLGQPDAIRKTVAEIVAEIG